MRIVIDTDKWHPLVRRFVLLAIVIAAILFGFSVLEAFVGPLTWWKGYLLGFAGGALASKPLDI